MTNLRDKKSQEDEIDHEIGVSGFSPLGSTNEPEEEFIPSDVTREQVVEHLKILGYLHQVRKDGTEIYIEESTGNFAEIRSEVEEDEVLYDDGTWMLEKSEFIYVLFLGSGEKELADWCADDFIKIEKGKEISKQGYVLDGEIVNQRKR